MPHVIDAKSMADCTPEECIEALSVIRFEPRSEESTDQCAVWLRKLTNNRTFLGDMLIEQIQQDHKQAGVDSGYGPQAIVLSPLRGNVFLRANIWPATDDLCFRNSGAKSFVYDVPHDHNFSFLTSGYLGPGYRSDYYEYDYSDVAGFAGEKARLRFIERSALNEGKLMLYRAHRDIHSQLPPESLSVSLNIMHVDPAQHWYDQYGFDLNDARVERVLSPNSTEAFLRIAIATGSDEACDFAEWVGSNHPSDRLRLASFEARALRTRSIAERDDLWRQAENSGSLLLELAAQHHREKLPTA
ncbi:MAG: transposase [Erythrobacter sp.]